MSASLARGTGAASALVVLLAAAPSALAAGSVYGGSTNAPEPIVLVGDRTAKKLQSAVVAVEAKCADGRSFPVAVRLKAVKRDPGLEGGARDLVVTRNAKGRFAGKHEITYDVGDALGLATTTLSGKLKARQASGKLRLDVAIVDAENSAIQSCSSGTVRWSATRSPGRVYGGSSSQEEPVVVRLDTKRKRVSEILAGWESSSCTPDGFMRFGERFTDFPLHAGGFSDSFEQTFPLDAGGKMQFAYSLAGKVTRKSVKGTLHVGVTGTDAAGATTNTCDSGNVTWKSTTG
jgi:hypothetical protein